MKGSMGERWGDGGRFDERRFEHDELHREGEP
jgi:hypothetical protein